MKAFIENRFEGFDRNAPHTVIVLGPPRSGTSMLAGILRILGIHMGVCNEKNHEDPRFNMRVGANKIRQHITANNAEYAIWGWKEPSTHTYFREVVDVVRNPVIIASYRNILAAVASKQKNTMVESPEQLIGSYARHYQQISTLIRELQVPTLYVDHEKALQKPDDVADRLSVLLTGQAQSEETLAKVRAFCEPGSYKSIATMTA